MEDNRITYYPETLFIELDHLSKLVSDDYAFCCLAGIERGRIRDCEPSSDIFSSCDDLISDTFMRFVIWVVGLVAFLGNLFVLLRQVRLNDTEKMKISMLLITNLALADVLMGAFLMIIATADVYYRGIYVKNSRLWRINDFCVVAGALATVSTIMSVFILSLMAVQHALIVNFPLRNTILSPTQLKVILASAWMISTFMAAAPKLDFHYFDEFFYGRTGMCLPIHLQTDKTPGWVYATFIYVIFVALGFLTVLASNFAVRRGIKRLEEISNVRVNVVEEGLVSVTSAMVKTDLMCWLPLVVIGLVVLGGSEIHPNLYAWTVTFILPFNSALNPILFTYRSISIIKKKRLEDENVRPLDPRIAEAVFHDIATTRLFFVIPPSRAAHLSMTAWLAYSEDNYITQLDIKTMINDVRKALTNLHKRGMYHGSVDFDHLLVDDDDDSCLRGFLLVRINEDRVSDWTKAEDERQVRTLQQELQKVLLERKEEY
ncbi:G-protein coupled receptor GRL101-like [Ptychodera flava]|uniref:G-protein coupled receptor GRL101-like n=1 Tax=Ptychodera flava TaxID=63121 RepID=UPI00396A515C